MKISVAYIVLALLGSLFVLSCTGGGSSSSAPRVDAEAVQGITKITLQNARVLCANQDNGAGKYKVDCRAGYIDGKGTIIEGTALAEGVSLQWKSPSLSKGTAPTKVTCEEVGSALSRKCDVELPTSGGNTELMFPLEVSDAKTSATREEFALVQLTYSITTFGYVPQIARSISTVSGKTGAEFSLSNLQLDPLTNNFGYILGACESGGRIFFRTFRYIYVLENGKVRLFAGSASSQSLRDLSHPLRLNLTGFSKYDRSGFSDDFQLVCSKDSVYVLIFPSDPDLEKASTLLKLSDSSVSEITLPRISGLDPNSIISNPLWQANYLTVTGNILYLSDNRIGRYVKSVLPFENNKGESVILAGNKCGTHSECTNMAPQITSDTPITRASDGQLYFADSQRLWKITPNGTLTIVADLGTRKLFNYDPDPLYAQFYSYPSYERRIFAEPNGNLLLGDEYAPGKLVRITPDGVISDLTIPNNLSTRNFGISGMQNGTLLITNPTTIGTVSLTDQPSPFQPLIGKSKNELSDTVRKNHFSPPLNLSFDPAGSLLFIDSPASLLSNGLQKLKRLSMTNAPTDLVEMIDLLSATTSVDSNTYFITFAGKLYKVTPQGTVIALGGTTSDTLGDGGPVANAGFRFFLDPGMQSAIISDKMGNLFISDTSHARIRKVTPNGIIQTIAGNGLYGDSGNGGPALSAKILPGAMAIGGDNELYFVQNAGIRKINLTTGIIQRVVGSSDYRDYQNEFKDGEIVGALPYMTVNSLGIGPKGEIYYADSVESKIRVLTPEQVNGETKYRISTLVGKSGAKDCGTGIVNATTTVGNLNSSLRSSLADLCTGLMNSVAVQSNCQGPNGKIKIAYSQTFELNGQVVVIEKPCGE